MSTEKMRTFPWPHLMTGAEKKSGLDRVRFAELLILQMPATHEGRNDWLLNYGVGAEAARLRAGRGLPFVTETRSAPTTGAPQ